MTAKRENALARVISRSRVARLLNPRSVAIVGVSERENTAGRQVLTNLGVSGYSGEIYLVSRNAREIEGRRCLASADDLPTGIDCAILTLPGPAIENTVAALARREVASIMCFASGFAEIGGEGQKTQDRIAALCRDHDIAFAGPNCLGFTNAVDGVAITFAQMQRVTGPASLGIGIVVQSGGMASVLRRAAVSAGIGFTYSVTTGNEAVVGVEDYLPFLIEDSQTGVIVMLVEQIRRPADFLRHAAAARRVGKPMVLLHLSRGDAARRAAVTHTGARPGEFAIMEALVKDENVVLVETIDELIDVSIILAHHPQPPGGDLGIVTESGAFKGFALDFWEAQGMRMASLSPETLAALSDALPDFVEASNPVDLTAQAIFDSSLYARTMKAMFDDPAVGALLVTVVGGNADYGLRKAKFVAAGKSGFGKPVLCAFLGGDQPTHPDLVPMLSAAGIPFFGSPERAMRAMAHVLSHGKMLLQAERLRSPVPARPAGIKQSGRISRNEMAMVLAEAGIRLGGTAAHDGALPMSIRVHRDADWGPVLKVGFGEPMDGQPGCSCYLPADATPETIAEAVQSLECVSLLAGKRSLLPDGIAAFAETAAQVCALLRATPGLYEIVLHPVMVRHGGDGVEVLDARMMAVDPG